MFEKIPAYVTAVTEALEAAGYEAYLVGGCVRDAALGTEPHDFDLTTSARPEEMLRVFDGWRVIETGLRHGTLTVMSDGEPIEVTTYRIDGEYLDNRHPKDVIFTRNVTEDLSRRDFTVNAMAYSPTEGLCDPFGGMRDLEKKTIACVGRAEDRFAEDGLRILRALRFSSVLGFALEPETADAVHKMAHLLDGISRERIFSEIKKLVCGVGAPEIFEKYPDVLAHCLGGTEADGAAATAALGELPRDAILRLAYVYAVSETDPAKAMRSLKSSSAEAKRCAALVHAAREKLPETDAETRRLMSRFDEEDVLAYAGLRRVLHGDDTTDFTERFRRVKATAPCVRIADLALDGHDVMDLTGARGTLIGDILGMLLDAVLEDPTLNEKEKLSELVKKQ